ncbi:Fe-S cluster assembly protein SufD, partial [Cohnella sp. REN36]|nr:Fe-S cluster assembly protein SufD [Cohnella sp. REN36]
EELPQEIVELLDADNENIIVQKHASIVYANISNSLKEQGVVFMPLAEAIKEHGDLIKKYLFQSGIEQHKVTALHQALWTGGFFVYVPKNVE